MMLPRKLPVVVLSNDLARETASLLDSFAGDRPSEGVVYWFGIEVGPWAVVTSLVVPNADTSSGAIRTSSAVNAEVLELMVDTPLQYLGQAHSHPGWSVDHSGVDDDETFARFQGAISVVVPWFGRYGFDPKDCGVHRFIDGRFRRVRDLGPHLRLLHGTIDLRTPSLGGHHEERE